MSSTECYPEKASQADGVLDTLSHHLRRELIFYFEAVTTDDTASLDEVVTHIAGRVPRSNPADVRTRLHHSHLPKLEQSGWIDYDARTEAIRYRGHDNAERLLTAIVEVFAD